MTRTSNESPSSLKYGITKSIAVTPAPVGSVCDECEAEAACILTLCDEPIFLCRSCRFTVEGGLRQSRKYEVRGGAK